MLLIIVIFLNIVCDIVVIKTIETRCVPLTGYEMPDKWRLLLSLVAVFLMFKEQFLNYSDDHRNKY